MKRTTIVDSISSFVIKLLNRLGNLINQLPTEEENLKATRALKASSRNLVNKSHKHKKTKSPVSKEKYVHKGSGYKGKGKVNTDAATFNHPR